MINLADKYTRVLKCPAPILLGLLEKFVNGALLQIRRVERASRTLNAPRRENDRFPRATMARLFLDAHFYFICIGQANKSLRRLCEVLGNDELDVACRNFEAEFQQEIRNHLEHIDERAVGKLWSKDVDAEVARGWNRDFVTFRNDMLSFGGKLYPVNRGAAKRLREAYRRVISVIRKEYALKDAHFVEEERRDAAIRQYAKVHGIRIK